MNQYINFLSLITRCKEEAFVTEFVDYYLNQGVDKIYIIDDNSNPNIYKDVINNKKVNIIFEEKFIIKNPNKQFAGCNDLYQKIKNNYTWMIIVDMDEFITSKKNINNTIRNELETTFKDCVCVKIPWVIMSSNSINKNPNSLLKTNIYRWNHDKTHINKQINIPKFRCRYQKIEVKCIFKPLYFNNIFMHHPLYPNKKINTSQIVESIRKSPQKLDSFYYGLREKDIKEGYLLCYHFRIISKENCLQKIKHNLFYKKYSLNDLLSFDYPEIMDTTLKNK